MHTPEDIDRIAGNMVAAFKTTDDATKEQAAVEIVGLVATYLKCQIRQTLALEEIALQLREDAIARAHR